MGPSVRGSFVGFAKLSLLREKTASKSAHANLRCQIRACVRQGLWRLTVTQWRLVVGLRWLSGALPKSALEGVSELFALGLYSRLDPIEDLLCAAAVLLASIAQGTGLGAKLNKDAVDFSMN